MLRHGGNQRIIGQADNGGQLVKQPLAITDGLLNIEISRPTELEMAELPKVWMTGNKTPWDPDVLNLSLIHI